MEIKLNWRQYKSLTNMLKAMSRAMSIENGIAATKGVLVSQGMCCGDRIRWDGNCVQIKIRGVSVREVEG